jgi:hypothetical protein
MSLGRIPSKLFIQKLADTIAWATFPRECYHKSTRHGFWTYLPS